jgi:VPDSG-CTERM motif
MKTILMVGTFLCSITLSQATTLTFEDLGTATGSVPSNYAGLTWTNWVHYGQPLPPFDPSSGQVRLLPQTTTATILFGQDVTFVGAWLAGHAFDQYFEGYNNGIKIFESSHAANDGSNFGQLFTLNWTGVDEIRFQAGSPDQTAFDDLQYNIVESVPDGGSTVCLLSFASLGLVALRRKLSR